VPDEKQTAKYWYRENFKNEEVVHVEYNSGSA